MIIDFYPIFQVDKIEKSNRQILSLKFEKCLTYVKVGLTLGKNQTIEYMIPGWNIGSKVDIVIY